MIRPREKDFTPNGWLGWLAGLAGLAGWASEAKEVILSVAGWAG